MARPLVDAACVRPSGRQLAEDGRHEQLADEHDRKRPEELWPRGEQPQGEDRVHRGDRRHVGECQRQRRPETEAPLQLERAVVRFCLRFQRLGHCRLPWCAALRRHCEPAAAGTEVVVRTAKRRNLDDHLKLAVWTVHRRRAANSCIRPDQVVFRARPRHDDRVTACCGQMKTSREGGGSDGPSRRRFGRHPTSSPPGARGCRWLGPAVVWAQTSDLEEPWSYLAGGELLMKNGLTLPESSRGQTALIRVWPRRECVAW